MGRAMSSVDEAPMGGNDTAPWNGVVGVLGRFMYFYFNSAVVEARVVGGWYLRREVIWAGGRSERREGFEGLYAKFKEWRVP